MKRFFGVTDIRYRKAVFFNAALEEFNFVSTQAF
ncbi:hypothetical protein [Azospirillum endophyticum]